MNDQSQQVLNSLISGYSTAIFGIAGSGKSYTIRKFIDWSDSHQRKLAIMAPTGIAAIQLGGSTIHSLLEIPIQMETLPEGHMPPLSPTKKAQLCKTDCLIVDEISMVHASLFEAMDYRMREATGNGYPFGGKQLVVCGDPMQLPPITKGEHQIACCFSSATWRLQHFHKYFLNVSYRQQHVEKTVLPEVLRLIRYGDRGLLRDAAFNPDHPVYRLNQRCVGRGEPPEHFMRLMPCNQEVDLYNQSRLEALAGPIQAYSAKITGHFPGNNHPMTTLVVLKRDARIALTANIFDPGTGQLIAAKGECGRVCDLQANHVHVELDRCPGEELVLSHHTWNNEVYKKIYHKETGKEEVERVQVGTFVQIPLRLAFAMTIHASQGLTLPGIYLDFGGRCCFAPGQLYVALSRVCSEAEIYLSRPIRWQDIHIAEEQQMFNDLVELDPLLLLSVLQDFPVDDEFREIGWQRYCNATLLEYRQCKATGVPSPNQEDPTEMRQVLGIELMNLLHDTSHDGFDALEQLLSRAENI